MFDENGILNILSDGALSREDAARRIVTLHDSAVEEGYIARAEAERLMSARVTDSEEYRRLRAEFDAFKTRQSARSDAVYARVKPKFFDAVYDMIDRGEQAKPVSAQLEDIRAAYGEYFIDGGAIPRFSEALSGGAAPSSRSVSDALLDGWRVIPAGA